MKNVAKSTVYQTVTDRILASLKEGIIPWEKPWTVPTYAGGPFPRNFRTGRPYRGVNVFLLWSTPHSSPFWLTFKQARELGGTIRKGEKGSSIVFYKQLGNTEEPKEVEEKAHSHFVLASYTVFNVEQCDGLTLPDVVATTEPNVVEQDATCEALVNAWQNRPAMALTSDKERRAYYRPGTDTVHMPARFRFREPALYYSTLFHELVHSTGHESRLNRIFGERFGDELYSKEELIAETGAAFLCALAGIANQHTERNTAAYLSNWMERLRKNNRLILQAAAAAQRAVDLITGQDSESAPEEDGKAG